VISVISLTASATTEPRANLVNCLPTVRTPYSYTARTVPLRYLAGAILRNVNAIVTSAYVSWVIDNSGSN
jgi:hypothetical protein